jgi:hypothetical protein
MRSMALSLKDKETDRLAREVAALMEIGRHCAALPDVDTRSPDEIVGYDEAGMWR